MDATCTLEEEEEVSKSYLFVDKEKAIGLKCIEEEKEEEKQVLASLPLAELPSFDTPSSVNPAPPGSFKSTEEGVYFSKPEDFFSMVVLKQLKGKWGENVTELPPPPPVVPSAPDVVYPGMTSTSESSSSKKRIQKLERPAEWVYSLPGKSNMIAAIKGAASSGVALRASVNFPWYPFYVSYPGRYMEDVNIASLNCKTAIPAAEIFVSYNALICLYERFVHETILEVSLLENYPVLGRDQLVMFARAWIKQVAVSLDSGCLLSAARFRTAFTTQKTRAKGEDIGSFTLNCIASVTLKEWMNCIELFAIRCDSFCVFLDQYKNTGRVYQEDIDYHVDAMEATFVKEFCDYEMLVKSQGITLHLPVLEESQLTPEQLAERADVIKNFKEQQKRGQGLLNLPPQAPPKLKKQGSSKEEEDEVSSLQTFKTHRDERQERLEERKKRLLEQVMKKKKKEEEAATVKTTS
jgi:hypothetical protein